MRYRLLLSFWFLVMLAGVGNLSAADAPSHPEVPPIIQRNYDQAREKYLANPDDNAAAIQFAHACFDRAEFPRDSTERANLANEGIAASKKVIARNPKLAAGSYYLAMNLAQLARTKMLGALPLLSQMESGWKHARELDEKLDCGGPDRYLGLLYRDAPGWPISLGDSHKAKQHLLRAAELSPTFPENYLNLAESYLQWNDASQAGVALFKLHQIWPVAKKEYTGEYWEPSWNDWTKRMEKLDAKLGPQTGSPPTAGK